MSGKAKKAAAAPRKKANGYKMPAPIPMGEVISDTILKKKWRIGPSIGVGGFGEIYSACDHENSPKKGNYPYVIKIEPHENGPLFVEKHFYLRNANKEDVTNFMKTKKLKSLGMPSHYGSGSHNFKGEKYRYLVLERYGRDIWSMFLESGRRFPSSTVFQIGLQMLDVLEFIHNRGYVHADIKGANILLGLKKGTENQAYLVDFGLATRVTDKEFKPDPKCAHNGTIEYTSRDAHLGVPTMRGDLEILGYNMLQWLIGELPWEKTLKQPKMVQTMKEAFMRNVRGSLSKYSDVPDALIKFFEYINSMKPKDIPDYVKCRHMFETYLKSQGKSKTGILGFTPVKTGKTKAKAKSDDDRSMVDAEDSTEEEEVKPKGRKVTKRKVLNGDTETDVQRQRKRAVKKPTITIESDESSEDYENEEPRDSIEDAKSTKRNVKKKNAKVTKRSSTEPVIVTKVKRLRSSKNTPPAKKNHQNTATQTSVDKLNLKSVSFDSPISEIIGERSSVNSSGDIFDDSFTITGKKVNKGKKRLLSDEELTVKRVRKKITSKKVRSYKDCPTVVNGRSPPV